MAVRRLERSDLTDDLVRRVYDVMARCHAEASAEEPYRSQAETEAFLRHPPTSEARDYWVAGGAGTCAGFAQLAIVDGSSRGRVEVLVHPDHRRVGHGTALLTAVQEQANLRGARTLVGRHATTGGSRFAAVIGAVEDYLEVHSVLRLPLAEDLAIRPVDGYTLCSWVGAAPPELLDSYARARDAINDAPDGFDERELWSPALVRDLEAALDRRGRDIRVSVALDPNGRVVAFTELRVSRTEGAIAGTEDTAVVTSHRRRGLGRWVKLESLRGLQRDRPDVRMVTTRNAEKNRPMLELNRSLGFEPVTVYTTCVLELAG